jgi:hypothetical protein
MALANGKWNESSRLVAPAPGAPRRIAVDSAEVMRATIFMQTAQEWRFLVRHLYLELGKPPVAGHSAEHVHAVLWGDTPPDSRFFRSLLDSLASRGRQAAEEEEYGLDPGALAARENPDISGASPTWTWDGAEASPAATTAMAVKATIPGWLRPREPEVVRLFNRHRPASTEDDDPPYMPGDAASAFAPPNPEFAETPEQFTEALNLLKRWSGLTLRQLEERSKGNLGAWMPRATASDLLHRKTLPKDDTLAAFTAACGLTLTQQRQWETVRSRLEARERSRETDAAA